MKNEEIPESHWQGTLLRSRVLHWANGYLFIIAFDTADCARKERIPEPLLTATKLAYRSEVQKYSCFQAAEVTVWSLSTTVQAANKIFFANGEESCLLISLFFINKQPYT